MSLLLSNLVTRCARSLPLRIKMALLRGIGGEGNQVEDPFLAMSKLAQSCGVTGLLAKGEYGLIQSTSDDQMIFAIYARTGVWADRVNTIVEEFFESNSTGTYIDGGANIGLTTIPIARNERIRCLAIEPEPRNFENLRENVRRNCAHDNTSLYQLALFSHSTSLEFELSRGNLGDHRVRLHKGPGKYDEQSRATILVQARPLDELAGGCAAPVVVKLDCQGSEPFVFEGGRRTLSSAEMIIAEWWPYGMARLNGNPSSVTDVLNQNFSSISIMERGTDLVRRYAPNDACEFLHRYNAEERTHADSHFDVIARKTTSTNERV